MVTPLFDAERFPGRLYMRGGLLTMGGKVEPKEKWTWQYVPKLVDKVRRLEERPDMPYYLLGHSGGGQFLERLAGFMPTNAQRIVVANPGTHLFASKDFPYPYGFGQLHDDLSNHAALKRYLAQPLLDHLPRHGRHEDGTTPGRKRHGEYARRKPLRARSSCVPGG